MRDIHIKITADGQQARAETKSTEQSITSMEKAGASASAGLQTSFGKLLTAAGGVTAVQAGFRNLVGAAGQSVSAFGEAEASAVKLRVALEAQGRATPQVIQQYTDLATTFQHTTRFGDDLIMEMQALLTQVGSVMPEQMGAALKAATDLSSGLGIDLRTATMLVGKAFEGETGTLKRYGIVIDENTLKTEGASAVLSAIQAKFGGQAQADLETYQGKVQQLNNRWNDFQERVGNLIVSVLTPLLDLFEALPSPVQTVAMGVASLTAVLAPLAAGAQLLAVTFGGSLAGAFSAILPFLGPVGLIAAGVTAVILVWKNWDTIVGFVMRVYEAVKTYLVDKFQALVDGIKAKIAAVTGAFKSMYDKVVGNSYVPDMIDGIELEFARLPSIMVNPTMSSTRKVEALFGGLTQSISQKLQPGLDSIGGMFGKLFGGGGGGSAVGGIASGVLGSVVSSGLTAVFGPLGGMAGQLLQQGMNKLGEIAWKGVQKIGGFFKDLFGGPSKEEINGRKLVGEFEQSIAQMLTSAQSIEAGTDAWKKTVIVVRDAYLAVGKSELEAEDAVKRLWESSKHGTAAVQDAIRAIRDVLDQVTRSAGNAAGAIASIPSYDWERTGDVPAQGLYSSGLMSGRQAAVQRIGGTAAFQSGQMRMAGAGGGGTVIFQMDNRVLAEVLLPPLSAAVKTYKLGR